MACNYGHPTVNLYLFSVKIITLALKHALCLQQRLSKLHQSEIVGVQ